MERRGCFGISDIQGCWLERSLLFQLNSCRNWKVSSVAAYNRVMQGKPLFTLTLQTLQHWMETGILIIYYTVLGLGPICLCRDFKHTFIPSSCDDTNTSNVFRCAQVGKFCSCLLFSVGNCKGLLTARQSVTMMYLGWSDGTCLCFWCGFSLWFPPLPPLTINENWN